MPPFWFHLISHFMRECKRFPNRIPQTFSNSKIVTKLNEKISLSERQSKSVFNDHVSYSTYIITSNPVGTCIGHSHSDDTFRIVQKQTYSDQSNTICFTACHTHTHTHTHVHKTAYTSDKIFPHKRKSITNIHYHRVLHIR